MVNEKNPKSSVQQLGIDLQPQETVYLVIQKHWGRMLMPMMGLTGLVVVSLVAVIFLVGSFSLVGSSAAILFSLLAVWYVGIALFGLNEWFNHQQSALIVTSVRIIDHQQVNFMRRKDQEISIFDLKNIEGMTSAGWGTVFNYGALKLRLMDDREQIVTDIPTPTILANQVMHYHHLVAHAGVSTAHNPTAHTALEDKTPGLAQLPKAAEELAKRESNLPTSGASSAAGTTGSSEPNIGGIASNNQPSDSPTQPPAQAKEPSPSVASPEGSTAPLPEAFPPPSAPNQGQSISLLMFHVPGDKLEQITEELPAQKEPTVNFLEKSGLFEVQIVVPTHLIPKLSEDLAKKGAIDLIQTPAQLVM